MKSVGRRILRWHLWEQSRGFPASADFTGEFKAVCATEHKITQERGRKDHRLHSQNLEGSLANLTSPFFFLLHVYSAALGQLWHYLKGLISFLRRYVFFLWFISKEKLVFQDGFPRCTWIRPSARILQPASALDEDSTFMWLSSTEPTAA